MVGADSAPACVTPFWRIFAVALLPRHVRTPLPCHQGRLALAVPRGTGTPPKLRPTEGSPCPADVASIPHRPGRRRGLGVAGRRQSRDERQSRWPAAGAPAARTGPPVRRAPATVGHAVSGIGHG